MYKKQGFYSGEKLKASQLDAIEDGIIEAQQMGPNIQVGGGDSSVQQVNNQAFGDSSAAFGGKLDLMTGTDAEHLDPSYSTEAHGKYAFAANASTRAFGYGSSTFGENTEA